MPAVNYHFTMHILHTTLCFEHCPATLPMLALWKSFPHLKVVTIILFQCSRSEAQTSISFQILLCFDGNRNLAPRDFSTQTLAHNGH